MKRPDPIIAIVSSLIWLIGMVPAISMLMMVAVVFDAPGSEDNGYLVALLTAVTSYPFLVMISVAGSWASWFFKPQTKPLKWGFALLPIVSIVAGVVALTLLMVVCEGDFVCK